jgi:hypothetical protein
MTLQVFGDSYTTPDFLVDAKDSFWGLLANDLNTDIVNYSSPGFSFDSILHILLNQTYDFRNDFFIIGIPPTCRESIYKEDSGYNLHKTIINDTDIVTEPISCLENIDNLKMDQYYERDYQHLGYYFSCAWHDIKILEKIYLIYQYFKAQQAKFVILNLSAPFVDQDAWPVGQYITKQVKQLKECMIFENTYVSVNEQDGIKPPDFNQYGWQGHPGAEGNLNYYTKIVKPLVDQLSWKENTQEIK